LQKEAAKGPLGHRVKITRFTPVVQDFHVIFVDDISIEDKVLY